MDPQMSGQVVNKDTPLILHDSGASRPVCGVKSFQWRIERGGGSEFPINRSTISNWIGPIDSEFGGCIDFHFIAIEMRRFQNSANFTDLRRRGEFKCLAISPSRIHSGNEGRYRFPRVNFKSRIIF